MIRRKRLSFVLDFLTLLVLVSSLIAGGAWHTSSTAAYAALRESDLSLESTRQAYELLLDRFVYPIEPSALLSAAWQGAVPALNEAHSTVDLSPPDFSGSRFDAWKTFSDRINEAWANSDGLDQQSRLTFPMMQAMAKIANE